MRQGTGVGLRYMTPIGPVRVEYGWPVSSRDVKFDVVLVDKDGNPISVLTSDTRKEKGQFFFSIGYPF
jgi:outer membrane protein assembly factor BamA